MKPKVSQSEEVGDGRCKGESRCQEYELWELAETGVVLVRGRNDCNYSIWKEMLEEHHYLHAAKLYGQQIKYLVRSSEIGWIGAMSFSSSAWRVRVRDERLGWDEEARKNGLRRVVSNSRFLIVPWLRVKNLASHVMSKALKRLPGDWEEAYKVTPVLELPLVIAPVPGSGLYRGLGSVLLGGLAFSTIFTVFLIPALLMFLIKTEMSKMSIMKA